MNNDSFMSNSSKLSSSEVLTVRPQIFNFNPESSMKLPEGKKSCFKNSLTVRVVPSKEYTQWKPKIPSKKLFEQPKFLLSIQRKKIKVINGLRECDFEVTDIQRNQFHSDKIKIRKEAAIKPIRRAQLDRSGEQYVHNNLSCIQRTINKTPLINFNLNHLIKQRKAFKSSSGPRKKGSNDPYYSFFSSQKFDISHRNLETSGQTRKNHSRAVTTARASDLRGE